MEQPINKGPSTEEAQTTSSASGHTWTQKICQFASRFSQSFASQNLQDLKPRAISALIMVALFLVSVSLGGIIFIATIIMVAMLMLREWDGLVATKANRWSWIGIGYITLTAISLIWLRSITTVSSPHAGLGLVIFLVSIVIATDISAYLVGRKLGHTKLAPQISPGKTWEGLAGGVAGAGLVGLLLTSMTIVPDTTFKTVILAMLLAFVAQAGDLFESKLKRDAGVKDSGQLIAGHGGALDRLDGLLAAAPVFALVVLLSSLN